MARSIKFLIKDIEDATVYAARTACVQIMNNLVEAGPAFTGEFSSAWYAVPKGDQAGGPRKNSGLYKYDLRNVPKTKFKAVGTWYEIVNTAPHAAEAMDLVPYTYEDFTGTAIKPQKRGFRPTNGTRGQLVGSSGPNTRTAPPDWWFTFNAGGKLDQALAIGIKNGFGRASGFR